VVLPEKLSNEQWITRFGHLADKHRAAPAGRKLPAEASASTTSGGCRLGGTRERAGPSRRSPAHAVSAV